MRILVWLLRVVVFVALFGLAIKNSGPVDLRLYFNTIWQVPLSLVILSCFAGGALIGATVALTTLIHQRFEIGRLQDQLRSRALPQSGVNSSSQDAP